MKKRLEKSSIISIVLILVMLPVFFYTRKQILHNPRAEVEMIDHYPEPEFAKIVFLGFNAMAADFLFTKAQYYYGSHYVTDQSYPLLEQMFYVIMALNPNLQWMVYFVEASLTSMGTKEAIEAGSRVLDKGMELYPDYYGFPFRKGFNYYYYLQDMERAYPLMYKGARMEGAPDKLYWLVSNVAVKGGGYRLALEYTKEMLKTNKDKYQQRHLKARAQLYQDLITLTKIVQQYKKQTGKEPSKDLKELISSGMLSSLPKDPYGGTYYYNTKNKLVETDSKEFHKLK